MTRQVLFTPQRATDNDAGGEPQGAATVEFFYTGTTTQPTLGELKDVNANNLANPLTAASDGVFAQVVYTGATALKAVLKDSAGATLYTIDPCPLSSSVGSGADDITFTPTTLIAQTNVQDALEEVSTILSERTPTVGGTADAITLTTERPTALVVGEVVFFRAASANTGATTINRDGTGAVTVVTVTGAALPANYIRSGRIVRAYYNGTNWIADRETRRGSGANGQWVQYQDGTLICTHALASDSAATVTWTYPEPFSAAPRVHVTPTPAAGVARFGTLDGNPTTTTADFSAWNPTGPARVAVTCQLTAIGTWY